VLSPSWFRGWFLAPIAALAICYLPTLLTFLHVESTAGIGQMVGFLNGQGLLTMLSVTALLYMTAQPPGRSN
jgi:hypothetical protein